MTRPISTIDRIEMDANRGVEEAVKALTGTAVQLGEFVRTARTRECAAALSLTLLVGPSERYFDRGFLRWSLRGIASSMFDDRVHCVREAEDDNFAHRIVQTSKNRGFHTNVKGFVFMTPTALMERAARELQSDNPAGLQHCREALEEAFSRGDIESMYPCPVWSDEVSAYLPADMPVAIRRFLSVCSALSTACRADLRWLLDDDERGKLFRQIIAVKSSARRRWFVCQLLAGERVKQSVIRGYRGTTLDAGSLARVVEVSSDAHLSELALRYLRMREPARSQVFRHI